MNRSKTPRLIAFVLAIAMTGLMVQSIADYALPAPGAVSLAKAPGAIAR